jgi:hypothetical protein
LKLFSDYFIIGQVFGKGVRKVNLSINYFAVLIAAVASMGLGFLWYSPYMFGKQWMKMMGYTQESMKKAQKEMGSMYALSFVGALVMAYVLSHVMGLSQYFYSYTPVMTGITSAFFAWIGFVAPVQMTEVIFGKNKNRNLYFINTSYQLTSLVLMGVIIGLL